MEYIFSWAQEKLFGTISWEYSNEALNINGRTSIWYAFAGACFPWSG
ncbi:MAG: putative ABC transporter permease [Hydrogeniiclostridium mannosilyticum]